jgi:hypothetical protein
MKPVALVLLASGILCLAGGAYLAATGRLMPLGLALLLVGLGDGVAALVLTRRGR